MNEFVVRKLKDQHNPRGNWQSKEFFLNTVSRNVFLFDAVKRGVRDTSSESFALLHSICSFAFFVKDCSDNNWLFVAESVVGGKRHSKVADYQDVLLVLKTLLTHKVNQWQKGRFLGGGIHNSVEVKEALDLFALGEGEIVRGGVVEEVMRHRNKGKRAMEFGRDYGEAEAGYEEEEEEDEKEQEELKSVDIPQELMEMDSEEEAEEEEEENENGGDFLDISAEDLEGIQMNWCAWKGVTEYEDFSEGSGNGEED